jgi:integrase/recombinase XerD
MTLTQVVEEYVTVKRSTGLRFKNGAMILRTFTRVAGAIEVSDVTQDTVRAFLKKSGPITSGWHQKHYTLAGFFRFAMQRGLMSTSPVAYRLPKRPAYATPYIYSEEELRRMLDATSALDLPHPKNGQPGTIPALTFRTLILLLYGAGLRLGEALAFTVDDVDLPANMLVVRNTKFFKTRLVPIGPEALVGATPLRRHETGGHTAASDSRRLLASAGRDPDLVVHSGAIFSDSAQPHRYPPK